MNIAFKEWAVICRVLATGRQDLILRKGGIAEDGGGFKPDYSRFWLYPTYFHEQQREGIRPEFSQDLQLAESERPAIGTVRLTHWVEVIKVEFASTIEQALSHSGSHAWTDATIRRRFEYRNPGLYILKVRVHPSNHIHEFIETPEYAGCKSWVHLSSDLDC